MYLETSVQSKRRVAEYKAQYERPNEVVVRELMKNTVQLAWLVNSSCDLDKYDSEQVFGLDKHITAEIGHVANVTKCLQWVGQEECEYWAALILPLYSAIKPKHTNIIDLILFI